MAAIVIVMLWREVAALALLPTAPPMMPTPVVWAVGAAGQWLAVLLQPPGQSQAGLTLSGGSGGSAQPHCGLAS